MDFATRNRVNLYIKGYGDGKKKLCGRKNCISMLLYFLAELLHSPEKLSICLQNFRIRSQNACPPEKLSVRPQNVCNGFNMRWEEKLHFSMFVTKLN